MGGASVCGGSTSGMWAAAGMQASPWSRKWLRQPPGLQSGKRNKHQSCSHGTDSRRSQPARPRRRLSSSPPGIKFHTKLGWLMADCTSSSRRMRAWLQGLRRQRQGSAAP